MNSLRDQAFAGSGPRAVAPLAYRVVQGLRRSETS